MRLDDYDFALPPGAIARYPADERGASRLMVLGREDGTIRHQRFGELQAWLRPGDLLVLNDTRVMKARLLARREPGQGRLELLMVDPVDSTDTTDRVDAAASADWAGQVASGAPLESVTWRCLARPAKKLRAGQALTIDGGLSARVLRVEDGGFVVIDFGRSGSEVAEHFGRLPLPPYLERPAEEDDEVRYQTVYARADAKGSVAAPTAGLHFTPELLDRLRAQGVRTATVTLHVGPGTFLPVRTDDIEAHRMHMERFRLPPETAEALIRCRDAGGRVVAVGTTVTRVLEAVGWPPRPTDGQTDLFIRPGHRFSSIDMLLTNFHLPRSTLVILVSAFAGRTSVLHAYEEAVRAGYRFFSYGDAMLIG